MKKVAFLLCSIILTLNMFAGVAFASKDLKLNVNGQAAKFEYGTPFIDNGSSLLPLRDLLIALGVQNDDEHIIWNGDEQSVTVIKDEKTVKLSVGAKEIFLNGELYRTLEVPAKNVEGRVYLPARAVAEALGFFVDFDANSWTILVQDVPFGGGAKADDYDNGTTATSSVGIETMKAALKQFTDGVSLSDASVKVLEQNEQAFFSPDRSKLSLDKLAKATLPGEIAKSPSSYAGSIINLTFMEIDSIHELLIGNGQTVTGAVGHTGGKYREMTEKWKDSTYFQVFYLGTTKLAKGDSATVNGVVIGETTVELTNALGVKFNAPLYVIIAGNLLSSSEEYDIRKEQSESNPGKISIPDLDKEPTYAQKALQNLSVKMKGGKLEIFDEWAGELEIKELQIMDYKLPISKTLRIPSKYDGGLAISLDSFVNNKGEPFVPKDGETYFIKIVTNAGEITRSEMHDRNAAAKADEKIFQELQYGYMGSPIKLEQDNIVAAFSPTPEFVIKKIIIENEYVYTPPQPITINENNYSLTIPLGQFKNAAGQSFKSIANLSGWRPTYGVTLVTNYGELKWGF